jgi:lysophospholipase L1-like esterase
MLKKILLIILIIVLLLVVIEAIALLRLKASLTSYATYWKQLPSTGTITYVALGDSTAQGIGASKPEYGYVGLIAKRIEDKTGQKVRVVNLSVSGAKIEDVINQQLPILKNYKPDLITIDIGGNDVAQKYNSADFEQRFNRLASLLPAGTYVGNMPYFGGRIKHNPQAIDANRHIAVAAKSNGLRLVDLQKITKERNAPYNYASDLFHPSNRGYKNWADAFWQSIDQNTSKF